MRHSGARDLALAIPPDSPLFVERIILATRRHGSRSDQGKDALVGISGRYPTDLYRPVCLLCRAAPTYLTTIETNKHVRNHPTQRKEIEMARSRSSAKPNIVVIWGDDIGMANLSCY